MNTNPVMPDRPVKASEMPVGQKIEKTIPATGPARIESDSDIEVVDRPVSNSKLEMLAFMEEPVEVIVHRTSDKLAEQVPAVWVNGVAQRFQRGVRQVVKRKFVEALARARDIRYDQVVEIDRNTGEPVNRMIPQIGLKYAFDVTEDKNPKGRAWLSNVMQEA